MIYLNENHFLVTGVILILLYGSILLHVCHSRRFIVSRTGVGSCISVHCLWHSLLQLAVILLCCYFQLPLFVLAFLLYLTYFLTFIQFAAESKLRFFFWVNIHTIGLACYYLIPLSLLSLVTGETLHDLYMQPHYCLALFICAYLLLFLGEYILFRIGTLDRIMKLDRDILRFRQVVHFQWYGVIYLFFDSFTIHFNLPYQVLSAFIGGSCILLLMQMALFITHTLSIMEEAHYEMEYYRLEEERADHIRRHLELQELAYRDTLTGTYSRRFAMELLDSMNQDHKEATVAYVDVNCLKLVNDTFGHQEGDRYLMLVAEMLNRSLRKSDVLARIGGDEFLIICIGLKKDSLTQLLEQINRELQSHNGNGYIPSFSFGIAQAGWSNTLDRKELIQQSDRLMYHYKKTFKKSNEG